MLHQIPFITMSSLVVVVQRNAAEVASGTTVEVVKAIINLMPVAETPKP